MDKNEKKEELISFYGDSLLKKAYKDWWRKNCYEKYAEKMWFRFYPKERDKNEKQT